MSLKIHLDNSLKATEFNEFETLKTQRNLNLREETYYSEYEKSERLIGKVGRYKTQNNFVNAFLDSYNLHRPLKIRPDDIKLQLLMVISTFVNNNAEEMREFFVEHSGKKNLIVESSWFDLDYFAHTFGKLLEENIKDPVFAQHYRSKFSTTTNLISIVNNITLMNTLKEYFSFTMMLCCGIPSVILEGTQHDWISLRETYEYFKSITVNSELKNWYTHFDVIMDMFIEMRMLKESGEVNQEDVPSKIKELFKRVITYIPQGSGGDQILGGWIRLFCPHSGVNKIIKGLDKEIKCLDVKCDIPTCNGKYDYYDYQDTLKEYYFGCDWSSISTSIMTTPAKLIDYDGTEYEVEFNSGFFTPHLNEDGEIEMNIGVCVRENQEIKKNNMKNEYVQKGVKVSSDGTLEIPKVLRKELHIILECFDSFCYNFYGTDPIQEKEKQYYFDKGLKQISKYKVECPSELKDDIVKISETFEVEKYYIKFI